jgi:hypothetical protein
MRNISIMAKILLLVSIMIALLIVVSSVGYISSINMSAKADEMYQKFASPAIWLLESKSLATNVRRAVGRAPSIGASLLHVIEAQTKDSREKVNENFAKYEGSDMSDQEKKIYAELQQARSKVVAAQNEIIKAVRDNDVEIGRAHV